MKYSVSLILILLFSLQVAYSQVADSSLIIPQQSEYNQYILKSKKQKKSGIILLAVGAVAAAGGIAIMVDNIRLFSDEQSGGFKAGTGLAVLGGAAVIISVPVLISSGSNKRKAKAFVATGELGEHFNNSPYTSIGVYIEF